MNDLGVSLTEDMMVEFIIPMAIGGGIGALSSSLATKANIRIAANLLKAKEKCPDANCRAKVTEEIDKFKSKIGDKGWSMARRAAGGVLTGLLGVGAYHFYDKHKKKKGLDNLKKAALEKALNDCEKLPRGKVGKCKDSVSKKYEQFHAAMDFKKVYNNE